VKIDPAADDSRQLLLHPEKTQPRHVTGFEFHQHVHVAGIGEIVPEHRPEKGQAPDVMTLAKFGKRFPVYVHLIRQLNLLVPS
jgi:hypothetical protein